MFWIVALLIAVAAAILLALPLFRPDASAPAAAVNDAEVYRDQLSELDRDEAAGLIQAEEARQARAEIGRRLIAASETEAAAPQALGRPTALITAGFLCLFIPIAGGLLYARTGDPGLPDLPLAERMTSPDPDINILIAKTEAHLAANPKDGRGWELIAPIYMRRMRAEDAANAYANAIRYSGGNAELYGGMGEAIVAKDQGVVTKDAGDAFRQALTFDPADPRARFYVALAEAQAGDPDKAIADLKALSKDSPPDAPWQEMVNIQIARIANEKQAAQAPGNPTGADIQAAAGLNDADRAQMIRTMVETLDERLKTEPNNFEGWQRLIRSFMVLGEPDRAKDALKRALAAFPAATENGKALQAMAQELGVQAAPPSPQDKSPEVQKP